MGRDIRESTPRKVGVLAVELLGASGKLGQVALDGRLLEPGTLEDIGETTGRGVPGVLGAHARSTTDGSDIGTGSREDGVELGALAITRLAGGTDTYNCESKHYKKQVMDFLPSSPEEWRMDRPRTVFKPIRLQTALAYLTGTV